MLLPAILRAATELFAQRGFQQPTMDEVAKAAGVRKATLYAYFDSKSALINAVVDRWLCEMPVVSLADRGTPLRQQLIETGLQVQKLSAHAAAISLTKRRAEVEQCLTTRQLDAWQRRYVECEDFLADLLERRCGCEYPRQAAYQFLILAIGGLDALPVGPQIADMSRIESAAELILRAYGKGST
jgi:AcrR family transcriptional regulator